MDARAKLRDAKRIVVKVGTSTITYPTGKMNLSRLESLVGKSATEWRFRDMHTRWGSCNVRARRIWLSIHLAKQHPEALRYVAIHELTHLWEANHGPEFKARMDRYYPRWREVRKLLRIGADFE